MAGQKQSETENIKMVADRPLVKNLDNSDYMQIILDGNKTLAERFEKIDSFRMTEKLKTTFSAHDLEKLGVMNFRSDTDYKNNSLLIFRSNFRNFVAFNIKLCFTGFRLGWLPEFYFFCFVNLLQPLFIGHFNVFKYSQIKSSALLIVHLLCG